MHSKKQNTYQPHYRHRYEYRLKNNDEDRGFSKSSKELYLIGLFVGTFLRRDAYYTGHKDSILRAMRGGVPVYFLARDMSIFWRFFKDQYDSAKIVVGVNRKTGGDYQKALIFEQVDLKHKGIVFDSGFRGSCIDPIIRHSGYKTHDGKRIKFLRGLMLSGAPDSLFPYIHDSNKSRSHRQVIYELEHCPKSEKCEQGVDVSYGQNGYYDYACFNSLDKNALIKERAFELGFRAGMQGLNQHLLKNIYVNEQRKRALREKIQQMQRNNRSNDSMKQKLILIDLITKYGYAYFKNIYIGEMMKLPNTPENIKRYGKGFISEANAKRYEEIKASVRLMTNFQNHIKQEVKLQAHLDRIAHHESMIKEINESWHNQLMKAFTPMPIAERAFDTIMSGNYDGEDIAYLNQFLNTENIDSKFVKQGNYLVLNNCFRIADDSPYHVETIEHISISYKYSYSLRVTMIAALIFDAYRLYMPMFDDKGVYHTGKDDGLINGSNLRNWADRIMQYVEKRVNNA